jgi:hypothetical protein
MRSMSSSRIFSVNQPNRLRMVVIKSIFSDALLKSCIVQRLGCSQTGDRELSTVVIPALAILQLSVPLPRESPRDRLVASCRIPSIQTIPPSARTMHLLPNKFSLASLTHRCRQTSRRTTFTGRINANGCHFEINLRNLTPWPWRDHPTRER